MFAVVAVPRLLAAAELPRDRWPELLDEDKDWKLFEAAVRQADAEPGNYEIRLRAAQLGFYVWRLEKKDLKKRLNVAKTVAKVSQQAVALRPDHPGGYHWLGAGIGMIGLTQGVLNSLMLVPQVRTAFEKSIAINPGWLHGSALAQLSRLYTMVPGFPLSIGNADKAEELARQAIKEDPNYVLQRLYLADILWMEGKNTAALKELDTLDNLKVNDELMYFALEVSKVKAEELRKLIKSGAKRDRFYDVLSDIQPGIVH